MPIFSHRKNKAKTAAKPFRLNRLPLRRTAEPGVEGSPPPVRSRGIYLLPNAFTTAALFCGFYAIVMAMNQQFSNAAVAIFAAMVLDATDGRVARLTNTQSEFGAQYDSLSDMVSFGAAPALIVYEWALRGMGKLAGGLHLLCRRGTTPRTLQHQYRCGRQALLPGAAQPGSSGAGGRFHLADG